MPPVSCRSSSISSGSTSSSTSSAIKKKFSCTHPACGKSFSRSEHLHRHALNHKDGNNTCVRCSAHFRRRDLLDRHMARHKEKDDEAGGEGLGFLATRKRLWRDADGKIVNARRPYSTLEGSKRRCNREERKPAGKREGEDRTENGRMMNALPSPPMSAYSTSSSSPRAFMSSIQSPNYADVETFGDRRDDPIDPLLRVKPELTSPIYMRCSGSMGSATGDSDQIGDVDALHDGPWLGMDGLPDPESQPESDFLNNQIWCSQPFPTFMGAMSELPYDDIFKPETGMYEWQQWNSQVLMSRCREKYDFDESRRDFKVPFGLGTC